jgi:hypothetical protein
MLNTFRSMAFAGKYVGIYSVNFIKIKGEISLTALLLKKMFGNFQKMFSFIIPAQAVMLCFD